MLDTDLRVMLASPVLARFLGVSGPIEGQSIVELLSDQDAIAGLRRITSGIAHEAPLLTLPGERQLVAEVARLGDERWVLVRQRPYQTSGSAIVSRRVGGRAAEIAAFDAFALGEDDRSVFFVEGPLGIGKTKLLAAFRTRCDALGCLAFPIDASQVAPNDAAILSALYPELVSGPPSLASLFPTAERLAGRRWVLLIDNFEAWTREGNLFGQLFVHLPKGCRIVLAGRRRPPRSWWGDSPRPLIPCTVGPLSEVDALRLAASLDIDITARVRAIRRAGGHPLSIVRLARAIGSEADREAQALDLVMPAMRGVLTRDVLEAASLPPRITEDLLGELLEDDEAASTVYDALGEICMRAPDDVGLAMPEVLREVFYELLRRRNPARFAMLQRRLALHYAKQLEEGGAAYTPTVVSDLVENLATQPALANVFGNDRSEVIVRTAGHADLSAIEAALSLLGEQSSEELLTAIAAAPFACHVAMHGGAIVAVVHASLLSAGGETGRRRAAAHAAIRRVGDDPVGAIAVNVVAREDATEWGEVSRALARLLMGITLSSRGVVAIVAHGDNSRRSRFLPWGETISSDGFHVSVHDSRKHTPRQAVEVLLASTPGSLATLFAASVAELPVPRVSIDDLRFVLVNLERPEMLATSPLSALDVLQGEDAVEQLRDLIREALSSMNDNVTDRRLHQILRAAFIEKSGKHEQIASDLGFSYGTFRRHMTRALERLRELLTLLISSRATIGLKGSDPPPL